jgi:hypothetical protein
MDSIHQFMSNVIAVDSIVTQELVDQLSKDILYINRFVSDLASVQVFYESPIQNLLHCAALVAHRTDSTPEE